MLWDIEKVLLIGIQESYNKLIEDNLLKEDKLYFCADTRNLYKGRDLYTDAIRRVINRPTDLKDIAVGKIYYISSTGTLEYYDGILKKWVLLRPRIVNGIEVEVKRDNSGNVILNEYGMPIEEFVSKEYLDTIPTSQAVYSLIKTQIDKSNNSGEVVTGIDADKAGVIHIHKGDRLKPTKIQLPGLLMYPHVVKTLHNKIIKTDENGDPISRIVQDRVEYITRKDENGKEYQEKIRDLPDLIEYQLEDGSWDSGYILEQLLYPVTGDDKPLMNTDIHVDPNNPNNGYNSKKEQFEFYLTNGSKVVLPLSGTVGENAETSGSPPNYTKYINVEGGNTSTANNYTDKTEEKITVYTDVKISENPINSLVIDGAGYAKFKLEADEDLYAGKLVWLDSEYYTNWIDLSLMTYNYYDGEEVISTEYYTTQYWTDANNVKYEVITEDGILKIKWVDDVYVTDESGDIFAEAEGEESDIEEEEDSDDNSSVDDEDSPDDEVEDNPEDGESYDEDDSDDDSNVDEEDSPDDDVESSAEAKEGVPVSITHWIQLGRDTRLDEPNGHLLHHCFKHTVGETETDSDGRTLLYYYTTDTNFGDGETIIKIYKHFSKDIQVDTGEKDNANNPIYKTGYDTNDVLLEGPINSAVLNYFSLDRFENSFTDDKFSDDSEGLLVDLTPYTKLKVFWKEINRIDKRIDDLIEYVDEKFQEIHDLLKIDSFD